MMDNRNRIQAGLDYIEENLQWEITAAGLAQHAGFSLFHYYRLFQKETGFPVMQYILRRRLLHGIYAIYQGSTKTDASLAYGFDTYAGFYKAFCREFGATPSDFIAAGRAKRPYRIDITREDTMTVTHKTAAALLKHWNLAGQPITDVYSDGTGNKQESTFYVGDDFVLKFTRDLTGLEKQISLSKSLANMGLQSATPVPTVDGEDYIRQEDVYFCLTPRLSGQQLVSHRFGDGDGRFVGEILGQLHLALKQMDAPVTEADLLATVRDWALPKAKDVLGLSDSFCREYLETFASLYPTLPRQIIHRDPNPGNILCSEEQWGFLDFDLAERNARIYDPCYAATAVLSETFHGNNDSWLEIYRDILRGYDSVAKLTDAVGQKLYPCQAGGPQ